MKHVFLICLLIIICSCSDNKTDEGSENHTRSNPVNKKTRSNASKMLSSVDDIRKEFHKTQSKILQRKLDSLGFSYECDERVGDVTYYYDQNDLKMIRFSTGDSHFSSEQHYYINTGKPYFVYIKETLWSFDGGTADKPETKDDITEKRFYISDGKPVLCLEKKYTVKSSSANNPKPQDVKNTEIRSCSISDLEKQYGILLKYKNNKTALKCL